MSSIAVSQLQVHLEIQLLSVDFFMISTSVWVSSGFYGFLPLLKNMQVNKLAMLIDKV